MSEKKKIGITVQQIAVLLVLINVIFTTGVYLYVRLTIRDKIQSFQTRMKDRYDKMVVTIIHDGLEQIKSQVTTQANTGEVASVVFQPSAQADQPQIKKEDIAERIEEQYQYFVNQGIPTIEMRGNYYIEGDKIDPFGTIEKLSPYQVRFSGNYVINNYTSNKDSKQ